MALSKLRGFKRTQPLLSQLLVWYSEMGPNCNDIKNILSFLSSFLHTNMCSCSPSLLKIDIITIWQWIFSTILLRKLLSFFGPTMSPGNLSLLSGPCLMKYCFKKHSPAHSFSGMCPERSYLVDGFNILSDHGSQPCCCHVSGLPHLPWRACSLTLCWFGLQAGKKTDNGYFTTAIDKKNLNFPILGKCQIPLLQSKWVHEAVTEMLGEGGVRTIVSSAKTALHCYSGLLLVHVLTVTSIAATVERFLKH